MAAKLQRNILDQRSTPTSLPSPPSNPPSEPMTLPADQPIGNPVVGRIEQLTESGVRQIVRDELGAQQLADARPSLLDQIGGKSLKLVALALSAEEMVEIRSILNITHISTSHELIAAIRRMALISLVSDLDGAEFCHVVLPEDVLDRIHSRLPLDTKVDEFVQEKIADWTQMFVDGGL